MPEGRAASDCGTRRAGYVPHHPARRVGVGRIEIDCRPEASVQLKASAGNMRD